MMDPAEYRRLYALQEVRLNPLLGRGTPEEIVAAAAQFEVFMKSGAVGNVPKPPEA